MRDPGHPSTPLLEISCCHASTDPKARFIREIRVDELIALDLPTLPIDRAVIGLMSRAKLAKEVQIVNGLVPGNLTRALEGEAVGTVIRSD